MSTLVKIQGRKYSVRKWQVVRERNFSKTNLLNVKISEVLKDGESEIGIDMRIWITPEGGKSEVPTKRGILLPKSTWELEILPYLADVMGYSISKHTDNSTNTSV